MHCLYVPCRDTINALFVLVHVKNLDLLELKDMDVSPIGTRVSVWTNSLVKNVMQQDMDSNGFFGMAPVNS
jgi:hypothetical protein